MANIKRGLKRIERVLLVLGCLGALGIVIEWKIGEKQERQYYIKEWEERKKRATIEYIEVLGKQNQNPQRFYEEWDDGYMRPHIRREYNLTRGPYIPIEKDEIFPLYFAFLIPISFAPYFVFKLIVWLVMGFKDDDDIKVDDEVKDDEVKDEKE